MSQTEIKARENGPYLIAGSASYLDAEGKPQTTSGANIALCRCGQSSNKPFCDGTHRKVGFQAPEIFLHLSLE
jgi:CDGSH-type Zn-finger protein